MGCTIGSCKQVHTGDRRALKPNLHHTLERGNRAAMTDPWNLGVRPTEQGRTLNKEHVAIGYVPRFNLLVYDMI